MNTSIPLNVDKSKWSLFVSQHLYGNIFQTPEMYEIYKNTQNYEPIVICIENDKNEILGILLAVIIKQHSSYLGFLTARSIILGGPLVKDDNEEILNEILVEYKKKIKGKAIFTQIRNIRDWNKTKYIFDKNGFVYEEHLDILIDLTQSVNDLWQSCTRDRRKNIKRGLSSLEIKEINNLNDIDNIYKLIYSVYKRVKLPLPNINFFINSFVTLNKKGFIKIFGSFINRNLIGVRIVLCYKDLIYDWYAGADDSFLEYRPNDVLLWYIFLWGKDNNFKFFDFGGAGKPNKPYGVRDYKLKFGGQLVNFGRFELVHKPVLYRLGLIGFFIYKRCYGLFKRKSH